MRKITKGLCVLLLGCMAFSLTACSPDEVLDKVLEKTDKREDAVEEEEVVEKVKIDVAKPEITTNLSGSVNYVVGDSAEPLKVEATISDAGTLSYQWYRNTTNSNGGGSIIEGATANTYTPATAEEGFSYYYAVATNTIDETTNGATTDTIEIIVTTEPVVVEEEEVREEVKTGWQQDELGWWYALEDGTGVKDDWKQIDGKWYCFDDGGYARLGWYQQGEDWYYFQADRSMAVNMEIEGYHLGSDGKMKDSNS